MNLLILHVLPDSFEIKQVFGVDGWWLMVVSSLLVCELSPTAP